MKLKDYKGNTLLNTSYSTSEQYTGNKWHDGKKIYTKSYTNNSTSNGSISIATGLTNINECWIDLSASYTTCFNRIYPLVVNQVGLVSSSGDASSKSQIGAYIVGNYTSITLERGVSTYGFGKTVVTLRYTKK